jgi:CxxC motif-containing protein (DUF1111 family)
VSVLGLAVLFFAGMAFAQSDPGVVAGSRCGNVTFNGTSYQVCTGSPMASVQSDTPAGIAAFFSDGLARFQAVESVANSPNGNNGLGPRFNLNQCSGCHASPAEGGSGTSVNPQFTGVGSCAAVSNLSQTAASPVATFTKGSKFTPILSTLQTGTIACSQNNTIPSFITKNGPTLEVRFPFFFNANGTANTNAPNGGVETIFTVSGRPDGASGCNLQQPGFTAAANANNIIFRIPTPVYGVGLVELLDDSTLLANKANNANNNLGIGGDFNHNGNDGTISRFGWKAQNKSGHIFAGEAYNVEMGISNLLFTQERPLPGEDGNGTSGAGTSGLPSACLNLAGIGYPEDSNNPQPGNSTNVATAVLDDTSAFANFMRYLAAPVAGTVPNVSSSSIANGKNLFTSVGCATCHTPTVGTTQVSNVTPSLSQQPVNAFSDFEFHHMGTGLADNVSQGGAGGDQFRTAPLWGLGQRIFLLHDGRSTNLLDAIQQHATSGSEAIQVEENFDALSISQQQDLVNFLRSL